MSVDGTVQLAVRLAGALLFASAALHKVRDRAGFRAALAAYDLVPRRAVGAAATAIAAVEAAVAAGLLVAATAAPAAAAGMAVLALYAAAIAINLKRGRSFACGCGGLAGERPIGRGLLVRNGALIAVLALLLLPAGERPLGWLDASNALCAAAAAVLLYAAADAALANAALAPAAERARAARRAASAAAQAGERLSPAPGGGA